jgi:hypothetical protein
MILTAIPAADPPGLRGPRPRSFTRPSEQPPFGSGSGSPGLSHLSSAASISAESPTREAARGRLTTVSSSSTPGYWRGGVPMFLSSLLGRGFGPGWSGGLCQVGSGATAGLVGLAGAEHGEDDVAASAGEADQRGVVSFPFGSFAVVERFCRRP